MYVLSVDQARHGGWCIFNYGDKSLVSYGVFSFEDKDCCFEQAIMRIADFVRDKIEQNGIDMVVIEDINMRQNVDSFKKLAWLQGALIADMERHESLYILVQPSAWQSYCGARGRTTKERNAGVSEAPKGKKASKVLSIQFVKSQFGIDTEDDNLADAISMGWYAVNNVTLRKR